MTGRSQASRCHVGAVLVLSAVLAVSGCSGEAPSEVAAEPVIPDEFQSEGMTWNNKGEMSDDDLAFLGQVFQAAPELSDSPEMRGNPAIFVNSSVGRRYYWLNGAGEDISWYCVGLEHGEVAYTEGKGSPF